MTKTLVHADGGDCHGTPLTNSGQCPKCRIHPDMQSTEFWDFNVETIDPPSPYELESPITLSLNPWYDSANSYPPIIAFEGKTRTIEIRLKDPDRLVQIKKNDFRRILTFLED